jgi:hypothetical protein
MYVNVATLNMDVATLSRMPFLSYESNVAEDLEAADLEGFIVATFPLGVAKTPHIATLNGSSVAIRAPIVA